MNASDSLAPLPPGRFERETGDPLRRCFGHNAQTFDDARNDFVLKPAVESFGIFTDRDHVDIFVPRRHAGQRAGRAVIREQVQLLPQLDVHAAKPGAAWRGGGAL